VAEAWGVSEPQSAEERQRYELLVRSRPAVWLETNGYIRDVSGKKVRPQSNVLQRRIEAVYVAALRKKQPMRSIGLKPRKRGYSTMVAAIHHSQLNNYPHEGVIIGNKLETSNTVFRMMSNYAATDDFRGRWGSPHAATTEQINYEHGARVLQDTAKNGDSIRGMTTQFIHGTEVAYWMNAQEVMVALLNAIPDTGFNCVFLESTPNGATGMFFDTWEEARWPTADECPEGQEDYWKQWQQLCPNQAAGIAGLDRFKYVRVFAAWYEFEDARVELNESEKQEIRASIDAASWYRGERELIELYANEGPAGTRLGREVENCDMWEQLAWRRMIIKEKCHSNPRIFDQEYPRDPRSCFLASGNPVFDEDAITHLQILARSPVDFGALTETEEKRATWVPTSADSANFWRWEQPRAGCQYLITVDLAEGEDQTSGDDPDAHSVIVLRRAYVDRATGVQYRLKVAARVRPPNRMPMHALIELTWLLYLYYGQCTVIPEMNNSGAAFILGAKAKGMKIWQRHELDPHKGTRTARDGWRTTDTQEYGGLRAAIIWHLHGILRERALESHCPSIVEQLSNFVDKGGRMEAGRGHDDDVLALAIGVFNIDSATTYSEPTLEVKLPWDLRKLEANESAGRPGMAMRW
jgi:hypothetical protein